MPVDVYSFFNSSASYRVRIALALKDVPFDYVPVNIRNGEHRDDAYVSDVNPSAVVPAIREGDFSLGQSLAIIDWLDTRFPEPKLIPGEPALRARVLELSCLVACDIHPLNNPRVLKYLESVFHASAQQKSEWYQHWIAQGMTAVERLLEKYRRGPWCFGEQPTLADCCLVPQIFNAQRMNCDLTPYPLSQAVYLHASADQAFERAQPKRQPDFVTP